MSIQVLPAIIPESFEDLEYKMFLVNGIVKLVQIDVCDGKFVSSKRWPYVGDEENHFEKITTEESEGFPFWETLDFEADLMVKNPEDVVEKWIKAGAKAIVLHIESSPKILELIKNLREKYGYSDKDSVFGIEIGIAISPNTPSEKLDIFMEKNPEGKNLVDFVQFMGIDVIGYQGNEFDEKVYDKISDFRSKYKDIIISVDGGVDFDNKYDLVDVGVNKIISGSTIYKSDDIREAIEEMKSI
jgi:ribulose-phosphate 3-epimerase